MDALIPAVLQPLVSKRLASFQASYQAVNHAPFDPENKLYPQLLHVFACSDFVAQQLTNYPQWLAFTAEFPTVEAKAKKLLQRELQTYLEEVHEQIQLETQVRLYRNKMMTSLAWMALTEAHTLPVTMRLLSYLADITISQTLECLYAWQASQACKVVNEAGETQHLIVMALGKLGGHELNFSSDVDLIFAYPDNCRMASQESKYTVEAFFTKLAQQFIQTLSQVNEYGFVFRVDMRLRPFGDAGPLVTSLSALESYYQQHGRDWERYALIKARVITGDKKSTREVMAMLRPFVYRRYIDYDVFTSLREMKELIDREIKIKNKQQDIKKGLGGIRQIEFIGQSFQLVRGGKEPILQQREITKVLALLENKKLLTHSICESLVQAYNFLRQAENCLQMLADQQLHEIPHDSIQLARIALGMGYWSNEEFLAQWQQHRNQVADLFNMISAAPVASSIPEADQVFSELKNVWLENTPMDSAIQSLHLVGFKQPEKIYQDLIEYRDGSAIKGLSTRGEARLAHLIPAILTLASQASTPEITLQRLLGLLIAIGKRSVYLALLYENPKLLQFLTRLCELSPWVVEQLCEYPSLLDELLNGPVTTIPDQTHLHDELLNRLKWLDPLDLEQQMDCLRQFKLAYVFRIAVADILKEIPLKRVSDHLTNLAEVLLEHVLQIAWHQITQKHGFPQTDTGINQECEFAILGYGKLGGIELSYTSDLDLVFVHRGTDNQLQTSGEKPISNQEFYIRLAQRIFHLLNTKTFSGELYQVDMRLRPSGESGLLVTSLQAFADYQRQDAWTWEHQALVRTRLIVGHTKIKQQFHSLRQEILGRQRDIALLKQEIIEMRFKMQTTHLNADNYEQVLKFAPGGVNDIEFIVQFCVLNYSAKHPILMEYTDNLRQLDAIKATTILATGQVQQLREAYIEFRAACHAATIYGEISKEQQIAVEQHQTQVLAVWESIFPDSHLLSEPKKGRV